MVRRYLETLILFVVGLGPTLIALLLMQQYGSIGISCAIVLSGLYLLCIVIALCCRICIPPAQPDADEEELQNDDPDDTPPSYDIVTSKPPPYYVLFATTPPAGEVTHARFFPGATHPDTFSSLYNVPVHSSQQQERTNQAVKCYTWIESCEDKDLPSYTDAVAPSLVHTATSSIHPAPPSVHSAAPSVHPTPSVHPVSPSVHPASPSVHPTRPSVHSAVPSVHPASPSVHPTAPSVHPAPSSVHPVVGWTEGHPTTTSHLTE